MCQHILCADFGVELDSWSLWARVATPCVVAVGRWCDSQWVCSPRLLALRAWATLASPKTSEGATAQGAPLSFSAAAQTTPTTPCPFIVSGHGDVGRRCRCLTLACSVCVLSKLARVVPTSIPLLCLCRKWICAQPWSNCKVVVNGVSADAIAVRTRACATCPCALHECYGAHLSWLECMVQCGDPVGGRIT